MDTKHTGLSYNGCQINNAWQSIIQILAIVMTLLNGMYRCKSKMIGKH